jgi:hypothetical protein
MPERALPRRRAQPRRHAAVRAVPASGAHAEAPERPPVAALRWWELPYDGRGKWTVPGGANPQVPRAHAQPPPSSAARHLRRLSELVAPPASMAV